MLKIVLISFGIIIAALAVSPHVFSLNNVFSFKKYEKMKTATAPSKEPSVQLYFTNSCPYCHKVLEFVEKNDLSVAINYIDDDEVKRQKLLSIGGKPQVPCLIMNDEIAMYESDAIIHWLKENKGVLPAN